jgi:hypothetical protein
MFRCHDSTTGSTREMDSCTGDRAWPSSQSAMVQFQSRRNQHAERSEQVNDEINKISDALRSNGYRPTLRIEDVEVHGGGPPPA